MDPLILFLELMQSQAPAKPSAPAQPRRAPAPAQPRSSTTSSPRRAPAPAQPRSSPTSSPRSSTTSSPSAPRWIVASAAEALDARRARAVVMCRSRSHGDVIEVWIGDALGGVALVARARRAELDGRARVLKFEALA